MTTDACLICYGIQLSMADADAAGVGLSDTEVEATGFQTDDDRPALEVSINSLINVHAMRVF